MSQPVFHAPDHDHRRCTADALKHAEARCAEREQRLTPIRRQVLEVLLQSHKPLGAYEIMDRVAVRGGRPAPSGTGPAPSGTRPAPITVYRALDFLRDNGLVHRLESRNAFVAGVSNHASGELVVFLMTVVPESHVRPLDAASMALVVLICFTWGFNQPAIKLALHDIPPLIQCA